MKRLETLVVRSKRPQRRRGNFVDRSVDPRLEVQFLRNLHGDGVHEAENLGSRAVDLNWCADPGSAVAQN